MKKSKAVATTDKVEIIEHKISKKDLEINPELKEAGVKVGEKVQLPISEKPVAKKSKRKFIEGKEILSETKVGDRISIQTFDGLGYLLSKDEYNELVS